MTEARAVGLRIARLEARAILLGDYGSALHDPFANLDWIDLTLSENIDVSTPGQIKTIAPSASPIVADMSGNSSPSPFAASASRSDSWSGGGSPWHAFDRANDTGWFAASLPSSLRIDMGAATAIGSFSIRSRHNASATYDGFPEAFALYGSDDAVAWTLVDSYSASGWANGETRTFVASATWRYYEIRVTAGSTNNVILAEVQFYPPAAIPTLKLVSKAIQVHSDEPVPDLVGCLIVAQEVDFSVKLSRDGETWGAATVVERYTQEDGGIVFEASADVSGQPEGRLIRYCVEASVPNGFSGVSVWGDDA